MEISGAPVGYMPCSTAEFLEPQPVAVVQSVYPINFLPSLSCPSSLIRKDDSQ